MSTNNPTRSLLDAPLAPLAALTIWQPWASAIMLGKDVENRHWYTPHRGPLIIHAGSTRQSLEWQEEVEEMLGFAVPDPLPFGAALGIVDVVDCVASTTKAGRELRRKTAWASADSNYYFVLANRRPFPQPIPLKGSQGLFRVSDPTVLAAASLLL